MRQRVRVARAVRPSTRQEGKAGVEAVMRGGAAKSNISV